MKKKQSNKTRTKSSKKELIFQIINTILVVGILSFYFGRMFYYKAKLEKIYNTVSYAALSNVIIERTDLSSEDRLYENEDGSYTFKGNITTNYVLFCEQLFRVISIDVDGNMKAIANEAVGISTLCGDSNLEKTPLNSWLNNDVYCKTLDENSSMVSEGKFNYSVVDDIKNVPTDYEYTASYGLLTIDEYIAAGGPNSFLNFKESYWLGNANSEGKYYFVNEEGSLGTSYSDALLENVRPVIYLSYALKALSGNGTAEDPFVLFEHTNETISDVGAGSYVSYADRLWRVCEKNEDGSVKLIANENLKNEDGDILVTFGEKANFSNSSGIGKYLNSIELGIANEDYLVEATWNGGAIDDSYDYRGCYEDSYTSYVGLPSLSDLYLGGGQKFVLSTRVSQSEYMNYAINEKHMYTTISIDEVPVRPMIAMKSEIKIVDGNGSLDNPYVLEVIAHE